MTRSAATLPCFVALVFTTGAALSACVPQPAPKDDVDAGFVLELPAALPQPAIPDGNPLSAEKIELGRRLFYDKRLSVNGTRSCGSCHMQARAFTSGQRFGAGATGEATGRNEMTLVNVAYAPVLTWADPAPRSLEVHALIPLFSERPVELGLTGSDERALQTLRDDADLAARFAAAFPDAAAAGDAVSLDTVTKALASFQRTILSGDAPIDRFLTGGDDGAINADAKRGLRLFFGEDLECYHCHGGFNFTDSAVQASSAFVEAPYHNTGLYNVDGAGAYPARDEGLFGFTQRAGDMGRFKTPTLRNIALTAPYMHDGSIADLDGVLDHYARGGRAIADGDDAGDGHASPLKDPLVKGFTLDDDDRRAMHAFFDALTEPALLTKPALSPAFDCPADDVVACPAAPPSFAADVQPLLEKSCLYCHRVGGAAASELLESHAQVHELHDEMLSQIASCAMPADARLSDDERRVLLEWLACDDPNN